MSALTGEGIPTLLENLLVVAEVGDLKANPNRDARGVVVEASLDKSRGPVATVLVQTGTLRVGDHMVIGDVRGRVKAMLSFDGKRIEEAGPSRPVEVLGISGLPPAGEVFTVVADDKASRQLVEERTKDRQQRGHPAGVSLEDVHTRIQSGEEKGLNLIVKADTQGSIDAVRNVLDRLNGEKIRVNVIHAGSGTITENDVNLAAASSAIVLGFNSRPEQGARTLAAQEGVDLRFYDIIYRLAEEALTNVAKHSHAEKARLTVKLSSSSEVYLAIQDDGDGFDPESITPGHGVLSMRDYSSALSGRMDIDSAPGWGTTIRVWLPLSHA